MLIGDVFSNVLGCAFVQQMLVHLLLESEDAVKEELVSIAQSAVSFSPVDTGAYVTSFSFTTGAGRPRGKSSDNKPKKQNPQQKMQEQSRHPPLLIMYSVLFPKRLVDPTIAFAMPIILHSSR